MLCIIIMQLTWMILLVQQIYLRTKYNIEQGKKHANVVKKSLSSINNQYGNYELCSSGILVVYKKSAYNETNENNKDNVNVDVDEEYVETDTNIGTIEVII